MTIDHPIKLVRCGYCADYYDVGQIIVRGSWTWYPEGEFAYYAHCRGEYHQSVLEAMHRSTVGILHEFEARWEELRTASKEARDPATQALRGLFR